MSALYTNMNDTTKITIPEASYKYIITPIIDKSTCGFNETSSRHVLIVLLI